MSDNTVENIDYSSIKILVVDDEVIARKVIVRCLNNCGYKGLFFFKKLNNYLPSSLERFS